MNMNIIATPDQNCKPDPKYIRKSCILLNKLISTYEFGRKIPGKWDRYTKRQIIARINNRVYGRLNNTNLKSHFAGEATFAFVADGRLGTRETLLGIDIDCHKSGSYEGAVKFAEFLKAHFFEGLYFEPSTHGNGVHCYVVLKKGGCSDIKTKCMFNNIQNFLKQVFEHWDRQNPGLVELVEVKGHPLILKWMGKTVVDCTCGQLFKLPRLVNPGFCETTRVNEARIKELCGALTLSEDGKVSPLPLPQWVLDIVGVDDAQAAEEPTKVRKGGSNAGHILTANMLEEFPLFQRVACEIVSSPIPTSTKAVATSEDVAIFLMLLNAFTLQPNDDGSMPTARFRENWIALYEDGKVSRGWQAQRYSAIRNYLTDQGLIRWTDRKYRVGYMDHQNQYQKGKACSWTMSSLLWDMQERQERDLCTNHSSEHPEEQGIEEERQERDLCTNLSIHDSDDLGFEEERQERDLCTNHSDDDEEDGYLRVVYRDLSPFALIRPELQTTIYMAG